MVSIEAGLTCTRHRINKQGLTLKIEKNEMHNTSVSSRSDTGFKTLGGVMMPSSLSYIE